MKIKSMVTFTFMMLFMASCSSSKVILSHSADISKYKYVLLGNKSTGDMALEDIVMAIQNEIAENYLIDLSSSGSLKRYECADSILVPHIHINSETWDGGHTYITITFYDYKTDQSIAVVKSSGIGISVSQDQSIALKAIKKKLRELFK